jgi:hypothetical protein
MVRWVSAAGVVVLCLQQLHAVRTGSTQVWCGVVRTTWHVIAAVLQLLRSFICAVLPWSCHPDHPRSPKPQESNCAHLHDGDLGLEGRGGLRRLHSAWASHTRLHVGHHTWQVGAARQAVFQVGAAKQAVCQVGAAEQAVCQVAIQVAVRQGHGAGCMDTSSATSAGAPAPCAVEAAQPGLPPGCLYKDSGLRPRVAGV